MRMVVLYIVRNNRRECYQAVSKRWLSSEAVADCSMATRRTSPLQKKKGNTRKKSQSFSPSVRPPFSHSVIQSEKC